MTRRARHGVPRSSSMADDEGQNRYIRARYRALAQERWLPGPGHRVTANQSISDASGSKPSRRITHFFAPIDSDHELRINVDFSELKIAFRLPPDRPLPNFNPTWNLAPTDPIPIVRRNPDDGLRRLDVGRWGLLPFWAKDVKLSYSTFNARSEEVETKPAFREACARRRCLVVLDSFYEW